VPSASRILSQLQANNSLNTNNQNSVWRCPTPGREVTATSITFSPTEKKHSAGVAAYLTKEEPKQVDQRLSEQDHIWTRWTRNTMTTLSKRRRTISQIEPLKRQVILGKGDRLDHVENLRSVLLSKQENQPSVFS
jgi:hypothetical protein